MTEQPTPQPTAEELGAALSPRHLAFAEAYFDCNMNAAAAARRLKYKNPKEGPRLLEREDVAAYVRARLSQYMTADEVMQRLTALARTDGSQFVKEEEYEVPVYEPRSIRYLIDNAEAKVARMNAIDPGLLKSSIEAEQRRIAEWEVELAMDPEATYQKQIGTETRTRIVPSLEAAAENGVLFALESVEHTQHGLKFKRQDSLKALELIGKHHKLFTDKLEHSGSVGVIGIRITPPAEGKP